MTYTTSLLVILKLSAVKIMVRREPRQEDK